ncbi:hypothetical protein JXO52_05620 [bacterium]|nr:hypothetical protein [bacterium]
MLTDIIQLCIGLEEQAERTYFALHGVCSDPETASFWKHMASQEQAHIVYWKALLHLAETGKIRNIVDDPEGLIAELKQLNAGVSAVVDSAAISDDCDASFLLAYRLEFMLMHPAFAAFFILMERETGETSPSRVYDAHINGLIKALKQRQRATPLFELVSDSLEQLWARNKEIARQLAEIRELRGLLPICMHCHNIRDDKGFWTRVEHYIENRSEATFSHGICPDCLKKYYSEYMDD